VTRAQGSVGIATRTCKPKVYPRSPGIIAVRAPVAQWIERRPPEPKVAGSNPVGRARTHVLFLRSGSPCRKGADCCPTNSIARRDAHEHRRSNGSSHLPDPDRDATRHFGRMRNRGHAPRGARSGTGARTARCPDFTPLTSRYTTIQISPTRGAMIRNGLTCSSRFGSRNAVSESAR
jgi:hypothetical protein